MWATGLDELLHRDRVVREATRSARRATSSRSCLTSEVSEISATLVVATSITLSAMSASLLRSMEASVEARTTWMLGGRHCKNNSRRYEFASADLPSLSPRSCCICLSSCVGLQSPSSSPLMSCWSLCCSDAAVRFMSSALSLL